ncbi:DUF3905 domain-containing protein [Tumebacillus permanentifrigoris]|uniref:Uncharacterized protein DUF3905 n=1 Tax=Tumebacillus permanentifrigoris TaxID=378543 RepID=A0A316DE18_9BACL|nr:DUF3905 domain-containing protein [Tumebacillus permanentifrigoris]PWK13907.1 uncharacterized protein DUF3905 [Tumebacillus permanentifrigoris]
MTEQNARENKLRKVDSDSLDAPWRNTVLENWSTDVDPHIMSGDKYVDNDHDLGTTRRENMQLLAGERNPVMAPFMHPTHDTSMNNDEDEYFYGDD